MSDVLRESGLRRLHDAMSARAGGREEFRSLTAGC